MSFAFKRDAAIKYSDDLNSDYYHAHKDEWPSYKGGIYRVLNGRPDVKIANVFAHSWHAVVVTVYGQSKHLTLDDLKVIEGVIDDELGLHVDDFQ